MTDLARLTPLLPHLDRLLEATVRRKDRDVGPLERRLRRAVVAMWRAQLPLLLGRLDRHAWRFAETLRESVPDDDLDRIWNAVADATSGPLADTLDDVAPKAVRRGHRAAAADVGMAVSFDLSHPAAVAYLERFGARRVAGINRTTHEQLRTLLTQAAADGWSYQRTAKQIRGRFRGFGAASPLRHIRDRAELVAVTEVGEAYEHGQRMVIADLAGQGVATEKAWQSAEDDRVCAICDVGVDDGWIGGDGEFTNGLQGPLGHPGCRCALLVQVAERSRVQTGTPADVPETV